MSFRILLCFLLLMCCVSSPAIDRFVSPSGSYSPPFLDWSAAATNIQDAIDVSSDGDVVWVTNGIYSTGGKVMAGDLTNRVALDKALTVQSVNGPYVTTIQGSSTTNGLDGVRCAWLTNGAALIGFTVQGGATRLTGDNITLRSGGGIWCSSSDATVVNCIITTNVARYYGSGVYQGALNKCVVIGNSILNFGGGACYNSVLNNCTVTRNGYYGIVGGWLTNCIVYLNQANYSGGTFAYCCVTPKPSGIGNTNADPQLLDDSFHLASTSPCRGAGTGAISGTDIDGQAWNNPPSIGCDEWQPAPVVGVPSRPRLLGNPVGFEIKAVAAGQETFTFWWTHDGMPIQDNEHVNGSHTGSLMVSGINDSDAGSYQVVVSNSFGMVTSIVSQLVIHHVDAAGTGSEPPYLTWATAATNIQDGINTASAGEVVLVTNGVYAAGGKVMEGDLTNRIALDKALLLHGVNGPTTTIIRGEWDPIKTNGPAAIRCAWLGNGAILSGFTLRGGATRAISGSLDQQMRGGGVWGSSTNASAVDCVIADNMASYQGGGAFQVTLDRCTLSANRAVGSGQAGSGWANAGSGGGAAYCRLNNCVLLENTAVQGYGGGAFHCDLNTCSVKGNSTYMSGGGAYYGTLANCTVVGNTSGGYSSGGSAVAFATLENSIVRANIARLPAGDYTNYSSCTMSYCNSDPLAIGAGNTNADPQFLADGIHLSESSSCRGAGTNSVSGTDIDGQAWNNPPSIGCDEWHPAPVIAVQPALEIGPPKRAFTLSPIAAGRTPLNFTWFKDDTLIEDGDHYDLSDTAGLRVRDFGPADSGSYQVVVSNAFGMATSHVAQVVIHCVDVSSLSPATPYLDWATAANNIQNAIDAASAGDIVLVTNGVYETGGKVMAGDLTNRVALDKALAVVSVNGFADTIIKGYGPGVNFYDPTAPGPSAVRCAWLTSGAILSGFTLTNGATRSVGEVMLGSGGGAWCASTSAVVANCVLIDNAAYYGGGISFGTLHNSLLYYNRATADGGGAYKATLNNCTVVANSVERAFGHGSGTYLGIARNSILSGNYNGFVGVDDNYSPLNSDIQYCLTSPQHSGPGNINADPQFLDIIHSSANSPCRGAGSPLYAKGVDLDGEAWSGTPSMGCDEVIESALTGPLSVSLVLRGPPGAFPGRGVFFLGLIGGRASRIEWSFGDGPTLTNLNYTPWHVWTNVGDYTVTFTAYNTDNLSGVSTNLLVQVLPINPPNLQASLHVSNGFQFEFVKQPDVNYHVQKTTSLVPPINWQTLTYVYSTGGVVQVRDVNVTNETQFYRIRAE